MCPAENQGHQNSSQLVRENSYEGWFIGAILVSFSAFRTHLNNQEKCPNTQSV